MSAYYIENISFGPVAQWIEQLPSKQLVVGSIPARATIFLQKSGESTEKQILTQANVFAGQDFFFSLGNFLHPQKMGFSLRCGLP